MFVSFFHFVYKIESRERTRGPKMVKQKNKYDWLTLHDRDRNENNSCNENPAALLVVV